MGDIHSRAQPIRFKFIEILPTLNLGAQSYHHDEQEKVSNSSYKACPVR
jgi:hypothetical protein